MLTTIRLLLTMLTLGFLASCGKNANLKEEKIWVRGNCEMCKERIEGHVMKLKGVHAAKWDVKTAQLTVSYDTTQTNIDAVESICARVGHATKNKASEPKDVRELPECCQPGKQH